MGGSVSKSESGQARASGSESLQQTRPPTPECVREFDRPWRPMPWGEKSEIEQRLRNFRISKGSTQRVRILIVGEVGAGKSSYINSVNNAFQGRITCEALVATGSEKSFTKTYTTHSIEGEDGTPLHFVFNDVMGLERESDAGVQTQDITTAVQGFIKEGYNFNPVSALNPNDHAYRSNPTLEEQTFCLVNIIAADKVSYMNEEVIAKLKYIRQEATKLGMPQVIIVTRPDLACPLVNSDLRKIYTSKKIKEKYKTYKIINTNTVTWAISDVMGLEERDENGLQPDDIKKALYGHVQEGYEFNPASPLTEGAPGYVRDPSPVDRVHCLVSVVPANSIFQMTNEFIKKMELVRKTALSLGIPHVVLMTKIDADVCPLVKKDLTEVYRSKKIKEKMTECSQRLGPPMKCIFPVSNYHEEDETNDRKDVLILMALKPIAGVVKDRVEKE